MTQRLNVGVVSKRSANRFEWTVSDHFWLGDYNQVLLRSQECFSWGGLSWRFGLRVRSVGWRRRDSDDDYVDVSVGSRAQSASQRLRAIPLQRTSVRLGVVGKGGQERETADGWTNETGILKVEKRVLAEVLGKMVAGAKGRLVIFCEMNDEEEEWGMPPPVSLPWASIAVPDLESWRVELDENLWMKPQSSSVSNKLAVDTNSSEIKAKQTDILSPSEEHGKSKQSFDKLLQDLKHLLVSEEHSDVILKVQGKCFKAHKSILTARCSVFQSMFSHDTKEKESGKVDITDCDPGTFPDFLSYLYTGRVDVLDSRNVIGLYKTADKYCVQELKEECIEFMKGTVSVDTFCDVIALALKHGEQELIETCTALFAEKMKEIILTVQWQTFICQHGIAANELFVKALVSKENRDKT